MKYTTHQENWRVNEKVKCEDLILLFPRFC